MNELILIAGKSNGSAYGVLKTIYHPRQYYGGRIIHLESEKCWIEGDNSWGYYESEYDALKNAEECLESAMKHGN